MDIAIFRVLCACLPSTWFPWIRVQIELTDLYTPTNTNDNTESVSLVMSRINRMQNRQKSARTTGIYWDEEKQ